MQSASELIAARKQQKEQTNQPTGASQLIAARKAELEQKPLTRLPKDPNLFDKTKEFFSGDSRKTPQTENLPETAGVKGFDSGQGFKIGAGLLATQNPEEQMQIIQKVAPGTEFTQDEKGNIIGNYKGEEFVLNKPGASFQDIISTLALMGTFELFAPGSMSSLPTAVAARGGAGAATSLGIDKVAEAAGAEQSAGEQALRATVAGGIEAAVPVVGSGINATRRALTGVKRAAPDALPINSKYIDQADAASKATGVDLFPAQKTLVPSELETQSFIASLPGGAQNAMVALQKQNKQVYDATQAFLNDIAPADAVSTGASKFKAASEKAIDVQETIRANKASPLYDKAFAESQPIDVGDINKYIDSKLESAVDGGEIKRSLTRIKNFLKGTPDLRRLHNAKIEIDQMIAKSGENSLGNTTKREVLQVQEKLLEKMDEISPAYKTARETFEKNSPAVNELKDSIIGKVAKLDDVRLKSVSSTVFDAAETNPNVVQKVRSAIDNIDPSAYDELLRVELERRIGSMKSTQTAIENVPGQLYRAIFGNAKQRRVLLTALRPKQRQNAVWLEVALKRASLGRPGGSQTATREEIKKEFSRGAVGAIRTFLKTDVTKPLELIGKAGEEASIQNRIRAISEIVYNPEYTNTIKGIKELEKTDKKKSYSMMEALLNTASKALIAEERGN